MNPVELAELAALDEESFRRRFRHTPLWRARGVPAFCEMPRSQRPWLTAVRHERKETVPIGGSQARCDPVHA